MFKVAREGVYFLYKDGELVYIGETDNLFRRIGQHIYEGAKDFDSFEIYETKDRKRLERFLIQKLQPKYNVKIDAGDWFLYDKDHLADMFPTQSILETIEIYDQKTNDVLIQDVAARLYCYPQKLLFALAKQDEIPYYKKNGRWYMPKSWLDKSENLKLLNGIL